jgi:hypothetical protein
LAGLALALAPFPAAAQGNADPWDVSWLPDDWKGKRALDQALDALIEETGLHGQGKTIRENAQRHEVNPAFALAMFRHEAGFAARGTLAHSNKNPANIIATGECWGEPKGTRCQGLYGEVSTDGRFGRYATMADGIRAFFTLMEREYAGMTLHALINRACPPAECDVPAYVALVEQWTSEYQAQLLETIHVQAEFEGTVLDDRSTHFWRRGPDQYWHQASAGYGQHMWWTRNTQDGAKNAGRWSLALEQPGTYELYAYIPPLHATSRQSRYTIYCAGSTYHTTVDQYARRNQWVSLGRVRCAATGNEHVELSDETGETPFQYEIAFDAIGYRLVRQTGPVVATPQPTPQPSDSPAPRDSAPERPAARPVLLERVWKTGKRLYPFCCGGGVLIVVTIVLAIVYWDRLPFAPLR